MSLVINLFGGPCSGKSTTAAGLYYQLKINHEHCEMVREYVKNWVWTGIKPTQYDQVYLFGKQVRYESMLYHRVDTIITDSPFLIAGFYDSYYNGATTITPTAFEFMKNAENNGVTYLNFWLSPSPVFDERGRYNDHDGAIDISNAMKKWIDDNNIETIDVNVPMEERIQFILDTIKNFKK